MIARELDLSTRLRSGASILLLGPRGVGKTALARQCVAEFPDVLSVNLLEPGTYERYLQTPGHLQADIEWQLEKRARLLVFIDEVQKIPELLDVVHLIYENFRPRCQFLLTGSSARKLKRGGANLLAGRLQALHLHPLTHREISLPWERLLRTGTLPGIVADNPDPEESLRAYVFAYLKEEVLEEALVRKIDAFSRFLELAAQYHGEPLHASKVAKAARVAPNTALEYFHILEDTMVGYRLPGWSASVRKQLRSAPKFYLFDHGVVNALRGELRIELRPHTSRFGKLFEAYIIQEAFRANDYGRLDLKFSYWQTSSDQEVDLIVSRGAGEPLAAIEIKSGERPDPPDWKGLHLFRQDYPAVPLYCWCRSPVPYRGPDGVEVLPWRQGLELLQQL